MPDLSLRMRAQVLQRELQGVLAADGEKAAALAGALEELEALQGLDGARAAELAELRDASELAQAGTCCLFRHCIHEGSRAECSAVRGNALQGPNVCKARLVKGSGRQECSEEGA
jgi:hypothetical protein